MKTHEQIAKSKARLPKKAKFYTPKELVQFGYVAGLKAGLRMSFKLKTT